MASPNIYYGIGSIVWLNSGEHKNWPARICLRRNKKTKNRKDEFWVAVYGKRKGTWVPKNSVRPYEFGGNHAPSYPIETKWIQAIKEADLDIRGLRVRAPSVTSETAEAPCTQQNNGDARKIESRSIMTYCCGVPKGNSITINAKGCDIPSPFILLPKLPDLVLEAKGIFPIEHKTCCLTSCTATQYETIDDETMDHSNTSSCFKCFMDTVDQIRYNVGIFDTDNDIGKPIANSLVRHNDLYICEQSSEVGHWYEIEDKGAKCLKSIQFFLNTSDLILCCTQSLDAVKRVLLTRNDEFPYIRKDKAYVFFTPMTHETCLDIAEIVHKGKGRFLDAVLLTKSLRDDLSFEKKSVLLLSGDEDVYKKFQLQFSDISKHVKYLGEAGNATLMNTMISLMIGSLAGCLKDAADLTEQCGLLPNEDCYEDFLNMVSVATYHNQLLTQQNITRLLPPSVHRFMHAGLELAADHHVDTPVLNAASEKIRSFESDR